MEPEKIEDNKNQDRNRKNNPGGLFVPAGVLLGMGFGFLYNNLLPGLFIGLGAGFVLFAIYSMVKK